MKTKIGLTRSSIIIGLALTTLGPMHATAETDRITVEDPSTGAVMFRVTSSGNVTGASFDGAVLSLHQGATEANNTVKFVVKDFSGNQKSAFTAGGNLGIGMTAPTGLLHVQAAAAGAQTFLDDYSDNQNQTATIQYRKSHSATKANVATVDGEQIGAFNFWGSSDSAFTHGAYLGVYQQGAASTYTPANMQFKTSNGTSDWATKMILDKDGNVGIGTTAPSQKLEVNGGVRINTIADKPGCGDGTRGTFWLTQGGSGVKDLVEVCAKDAANSYAWRTMW